jgi:hypothetical protein
MWKFEDACPIGCTLKVLCLPAAKLIQLSAVEHVIDYFTHYQINKDSKYCDLPQCRAGTCSHDATTLFEFFWSRLLAIHGLCISFYYFAERNGPDVQI